MALTPYEDLLPLIQPQASAAPIPVILTMIQRVVLDFCRRSTAYRYKLVGVPAIANVAYYDLPPPTYTKVSGIILATYMGAPLHPSSDVLVANGLVVSSPHSFIFENGQARIISAPQNTVPGAFEFVLSLQPTMTAIGIVDTFVDEFYHDITIGVLAELLQMSNQPWSNPQLGQQYAAQYNMGIDNAKARANADHTAKVRTTPINWF